MTASERIGLLGGTFDPLHNGHLALAGRVRQQLALDRVLLIPASRPPHKLQYPITPFPQRAAMIEAALAGESGLELSLIEQETHGPSYSIDTLQRLRAVAPDSRQFYFIIGGDAFRDLPSWKRFVDLPRHAHLVVVAREGGGCGAIEEVIRNHFPDYRQHPDGLWRAKGLGDIVTLILPPVDISSTLVRQRVRQGLAIAGLVPDVVATAIRHQGLYHGLG